MSKTQKVSFPNSRGQELSGKIEIPDTEIKATAILVHFFTGNKEFSANRRISKKLAEHGIATIRFDFTGLGASGGDFSDTNFSSNVMDILCAAEYLKETISAPQIIIGHSLGGAAAISAASNLDSINAVITIGSPSFTEHVVHLFGDKIDEIQEVGYAMVEIAGREFEIRRHFLEDIKEKKIKECLKSLKNKSLLIFHSPEDEVVEIDHAKELYMAAKHPKSFITLSGADHLLSNRDDAEYVADVIATWCDRYIKKIEMELEESA